MTRPEQSIVRGDERQRAEGAQGLRGRPVERVVSEQLQLVAQNAVAGGSPVHFITEKSFKTADCRRIAAQIWCGSSGDSETLINFFPKFVLNAGKCNKTVTTNFELIQT